MHTMKRKFTAIKPQRRSAATPRPNCAKRLECAELAPAFTSRRLLCYHPERMRSLSPGLRGTSYPGCAMDGGRNPERVASFVLCTAVNPTAWRREPTGRGAEATLTGLVGLSMLEPRVARASQPWAERYNPVGIAQNAPTAVGGYILLANRAKCKLSGLAPLPGCRTSSVPLPGGRRPLPPATSVCQPCRAGEPRK